jgi:hypothetical protein
MSTTVISAHSLSRTSGSNIGTALVEVGVAFKHLATAVFRTAVAPAAAAQPLTAYEEAEQLRTYAAEIQQKDPDFAQDLFAAADRHEIEAAAAAQTVH